MNTPMTGPPLDLVLYRAALYLYPPAFRGEFSDEMREHVETARGEAALEGRRALVRFHAETVRDLAITIALQWIRSGWPIIAIFATLLPLGLVSLVVRLASQVPFTLPSGTPDAELLSLVLLAAVCVVLIATTIILTVWFSPLQARRRR